MLLRKLKLEYLLTDRKDLITIFDSQIFNTTLYMVDCIRDFRFLVTEEEYILKVDIKESRVFINRKLIDIFRVYWEETIPSNNGISIVELDERTNTIMQMFCLYINNRFRIDLSNFKWIAVPNSLLEFSCEDWY